MWPGTILPTGPETTIIFLFSPMQNSALPKSKATDKQCLTGNSLNKCLMTIHLVNSAMMPRPGTYQCREIDPGEFWERLAEARYVNKLKSYIGYPQNLEFIRQATGIQLPLNRDETHIEEGDQLLVMKRRYRPTMPKGAPVNAGDFQFVHVTFKI